MDSNRARPRRNADIGLAWRGVVAMFRKATFSSLKALLAVKSDADRCWCNSC